MHNLCRIAPTEKRRQASAHTIAGRASAAAGNVRYPGRNRATINLAKLQAMQWFAIPHQVTFGFDVTAAPQVSALVGQVERDDGAQGFARAYPAFGFLAGRVVAQFDLGVHLGCRLSRARGRQRGRIAERDAPMLGADLVLEYPGSRTAGAEAKTEATQVLIEDDRLRLALRQRQSGDRFLSEFHGSPDTVFLGWEDYGKTHPASS